MVGSISTLGVGSGLQLQDILDQLRAVDEQRVTDKQTEISTIQSQLNEFTVVNNKLLAMKSYALDLSLSSTFLERSVASSSESVLTATVASGTDVQSKAFNVTDLATKSSWQSSGMAAEDSIVYVPTSQESTSGVADPDVGTVMANGEAMTITFGPSDSPTKTFTVTAGADLTMNQLANEINTHADNQGGPGANGRYVTAETYTVGSDTYLRIKTDTAAGTGEDNRVAISEDLAALDFSAPNETFSFYVGEATNATSITVAADTTMSELVALINDDEDNPGVTASIIDDGSATNPYKFVLQADDTGEDNRIYEIDWALPDLSMSELEGAAADSLNAEFTVDGISYQRQTNTFSDVMTGVTVTLVDTGSSTVTVGNNDDGIVEMISGLITAYNDAVQTLSTDTGYDTDTETFGILSATTIRDLPYDLQNLMTATVRADSDGNVTTLFDLGLEFNRDGTISIDSETLAGMVENYPDSVEAFFLGDDDNDITGLADQLNDRLRTITGGEGQIAAEEDAAEGRITDIQAWIESETARIDKKYELLAQQFVQLDQYMSQMTSIGSYLTGQFSSLSDGWGGTGSSD